MLHSMTGFGAGRAQNEHLTAEVELKTLNSKHLELSFKAPPQYQNHELTLRNLVAEQITRGKVSLVLTITAHQPAVSESGRTPALLNNTKLKEYYWQLKAVQQELGIDQPIDLTSLLNLPGIFDIPTPEVQEEEWALVVEALRQALERLIESRTQEGAVLLKDIEARLEQLSVYLASIKQHEAGRTHTIRTRLTQHIVELGENPAFNPERFEQEMLYYLEKFDINEEKVRIAAHIQHFKSILKQKESQGRKLQFLVQELWRETNTLGVKAYDVRIQTIVVEMKEELEKIKEQLMNIV
jgi:uncharacterized protein (TIGR00255 family)